MLAANKIKGIPGSDSFEKEGSPIAKSFESEGARHYNHAIIYGESV
jgi:hypothetical protein